MWEHIGTELTKDQGKRVIWEVPKPGDCWDGMTPLIYVLGGRGSRLMKTDMQLCMQTKQLNAH